ncbi:MAG: ferritin-like domain-containing protein [Balneola sp.]
MDRKSFLRTIPIIGIAGGATLLSCSTGTGTESNFSGDDNLTGDNQILTNSAEREATAIQTYLAAAQSGLISNQAILDTAIAYKNHHYEHLSLFNELLVEGDAQEIVLEDFGPDSRINNVTNQEEAVLLAMTLEMEAANAYFTSSVRDLEGPSAREVVGSIFPIEIAHFVSLKAAIGRAPAVDASVFTELKLT